MALRLEMNNCTENNVKHSVFTSVPTSGNWFVFDLETNGLYRDVKEIFCLVIYDIIRDKTIVYRPDTIVDGLKYLATADVLIGHNVLFYDIPVINKLYPNINLNNIHVIDTLVCTRLIWPKEELETLDSEIYPDVPSKLKGSASLKAWGYRLSDNKIEFKDFNSWSPEMETYCIQDVNVTKKLFDHINVKQYPQASLYLEHEFAIAISKQIVSGFPFDLDAALDLVDVLNNKKKELEDQLQIAFPPIVEETIFIPKVNNKAKGYIKDVPFTKKREIKFNPGSRQQTIERLFQKYNWKPTVKTEKGNPILNDDVLESLPFPEAKFLAEYQLVKKRLGQISEGNNAWTKLVYPEDGKIHGDVITNGCITGRCAHRNPNTGQVPAVYSPYGKECRSLFHAPKDYVLIGVDAKALELRCLAGYLSYWDNGEYGSVVIDPEQDIHVYNQKLFNVETRDIAKRLLYGILYGCGASKAGSIVDPNCKDLEQQKQLGRNAINSFMKGVPALKELKNQIEVCISQRGYLIGLDRRQLFCRAAFKGLNVLLQSAGAIIMKQVVVNLHKQLESCGLIYDQDWMQVAMIHDEIQLACLPNCQELVKEQALKAFPKAQEFFKFGCLIEGDAKIGYTWLDCH